MTFSTPSVITYISTFTIPQIYIIVMQPPPSLNEFMGALLIIPGSGLSSACAVMWQTKTLECDTAAAMMLMR